jgi:hypothetical protein
MKISFNSKLPSAQTTTLPEGRHIGSVVQIASLGDQPAFNVGDPPTPSVGVVVKVANTLVAKKMSISDSPWSKLFEFLHATLPDPDSFDGDDPLPLTLGRPVAVEITVKNRFNTIASFHRPEDFELADQPEAEPADTVYLDDIEALQAEGGKALFQKLHRDIRSWLSKRVRG